MHEPDTKKSIVWKCFEKIEPDKAKCIKCDMVLKYFKNTTNLLAHIKKKHSDAVPKDTCTEGATLERIAKKVKIPEKSQARYQYDYEKFMQWRSENKFDNFEEPIFMDYFKQLATSRKSSSLWATYSTLRSMIYIKHSLDIYNYSLLNDFLRQKAKGYQSKKAKIFSSEQINQFLQEAPDNNFLAIKVALIFGVQGACGRYQLCNLTVNNLEDKGCVLLVKIPKMENNKSRSFVIKDHYYQIYKKYANLRPHDASTTRFFLQYRNGKCVNHVIGINTFGNIPKTVAVFLNLDEPESYNGYSFKRTSATLHPHLIPKRQRRRKSNTPEEEEEEKIEDSILKEKRNRFDPDDSLLTELGIDEETELQFAQSSISQLEKTCSSQESQIATLHAYIKTLGPTIQTLGRFASHVIDQNPDIEPPSNVLRIIDQLEDLEKQKKNPMSPEERADNLLSVDSQLESSLKVIEKLNEQEEMLIRIRNESLLEPTRELEQHQVCVIINSNESTHHQQQMRYPERFSVNTNNDDKSANAEVKDFKREEMDSPLKMSGNNCSFPWHQTIQNDYGFQ